MLEYIGDPSANKWLPEAMADALQTTSKILKASEALPKLCKSEPGPITLFSNSKDSDTSD